MGMNDENLWFDKNIRKIFLHERQRARRGQEPEVILLPRPTSKNCPLPTIIREEPKFVKEKLLSSGCTVINSAGNNGDLASRLSPSEIDFIDENDNYVIVEASDPTSIGMADFSNRGEVRTPGKNIFGLFDVFGLNPDPNQDQLKVCSSSDGHFIWGTSFAAPIEFSIRRNVYASLVERESFRNLKGNKQIQIFNRMMSFAKFSEITSGLKAIYAAESWKENHKKKSLLPLEDSHEFVNSVLIVAIN